MTEKLGTRKRKENMIRKISGERKRGEDRP